MTSMWNTFWKEQYKDYKQIILSKESLQAYSSNVGLLFRSYSVNVSEGIVQIFYIDSFSKQLIYIKPDNTKNYKIVDFVLVEDIPESNPINFGPATDHDLNLFLQADEPITPALFLKILREQTLMVYDKVYADYLSALEVIAMRDAAKEVDQNE